MEIQINLPCLAHCKYSLLHFLWSLFLDIFQLNHSHIYCFLVFILDICFLTCSTWLFSSSLLFIVIHQGKQRDEKANRRSSPCHDDKEIQSVPRVPEVTAPSKDPQGDHLYNHFQSEEDVDECIKSLKGKTKSVKNALLPWPLNLQGHISSAMPDFECPAILWH